MTALTGVVALALAAAASNADLDRAEKLFSAYQYEPALAALNRAKEVEGNDRSTLVRIFELQGVISGQLRRSAAAENAFRQLLTLDPEHRLSSDYAPRVMTPFFEAKRKVTESGPLVFKAIPAQVEPGTVRSVRARVDASASTSAPAKRGAPPKSPSPPMARRPSRPRARRSPGGRS
jgi:tetratricopeptide (TPR) repeat protein